MVDLLWNVYARVKAQKEPGGDGPGSGGDKVSSVLHWFARDAQEQAPAQIPNHDKFVDAKTTLWPSLTLRRTKVHLDSCSLTIAHTLLPRDQCDLLSLDDLNHNDHPPPPPPSTILPTNAPFLQAVSPHICKQNCTSWP